MNKYNIDCAGCSAGVNGISIRNDGTVTPCTLLYISCGNILTDNLEDILNNVYMNKIISRFVETNTERKTLAKNASILIKGFSEIDKSELVSLLDLGNFSMTLMNQVPMHLTTIVGAAHSNNIAVMQEDEVKSPNIFLYTL